MKVGIVGNGIVGGATAQVFRSKSYNVQVWDRDPARRTHLPWEVWDCDIVFVCVPEKNVWDVLEDKKGSDTKVVIRSTTPVGTTRRVKTELGFQHVYHWPEFLTARTAHQDAANPRLNVLGYPGGWQGTTYFADDPVFQFIVDQFPEVPIYPTGSDESELMKIATNSFFAVKVAFFNELWTLADRLGLDWEQVRGGIVGESRITDLHTHVPGPDGKRGFGGACLPKDLRQFVQKMLDEGLPCPVSTGALARNTKDRGEAI